jgi:hypothetical protein
MKLLPVAALAVLAAGVIPVVAQVSPSTPPATSPPTAAAPGQLLYYSHTPGEMRASKLVGHNVKNAANETIGEINELILDKDGRVVAVVVGVGGFLGIGQREVALDYKSLNIKYDPNAMTDAGATTVVVNATKESLKNAPAWTWNREGTSGGVSVPPRAPQNGQTR